MGYPHIAETDLLLVNGNLMVISLIFNMSQLNWRRFADNRFRAFLSGYQKTRDVKGGFYCDAFEFLIAVLVTWEQGYVKSQSKDKIETHCLCDAVGGYSAGVMDCL